MGRKTKKEKILAELRRKQRLIEGTLIEKKQTPKATPASFPPGGQVMETKYVLPANQNLGLIKAKITGTPDSSYVITDLRRILTLTALAICAQLVLWYLLGNRIAG